MATRSKSVDPSSPTTSRQVSFSTASGEFTNGDVLDIYASLHRHGVRLEVSCGAGDTVTFRVNSIQKRYPLYSEALVHDIPAPDLQKEATWTNTLAPTYTVEAGTTFILDDLPIQNIEITALTASTDVVFTVR